MLVTIKELKDLLKKFLGEIFSLKNRITPIKIFFRIVRLSLLSFLPILFLLGILEKLFGIVSYSTVAAVDKIDRFCQKYDGTVESEEKEEVWKILSEKE